MVSQKVSQVDVFRVNPGADGHSQPQRVTTLDISAQDKPGFTPLTRRLAALRKPSGAGAAAEFPSLGGTGGP